MTPICVECKLSMRCAQNDFVVRDPAFSTESTVWLGDKFQCPECEKEIVVGFGGSRLASNCDPAMVAEALEFRYERP